jgi:hypothetical protein
VQLPLRAKLRPLGLAVSMAFSATNSHAATITVTDAGDAGTATTCTLRQAIVSANKNAHGDSSCVDGDNDDTVRFADALVGSTITLGGSELAVTAPLTIEGSGQTLDANHASRVMYVGFTTLKASNLNLVNGASPGNSGGGMFLFFSTVSLSGVTVSGNTADYAAGIAAFNYSNLTLTGSSVSSNTAAHKGGGLEIVNGTEAKLNDSVISGNSASRGGGVFVSFYGTLSLTRSTVSGNTAVGAPTQRFPGISATIVAAAFSRSTAACRWSMPPWPPTAQATAAGSMWKTGSDRSSTRWSTRRSREIPPMAPPAFLPTRPR